MSCKGGGFFVVVGFLFFYGFGYLSFYVLDFMGVLVFVSIFCNLEIWRSNEVKIRERENL